MADVLRFPSPLQAAARRFLYDLETSAFYSACDETPAHQVWSNLPHGTPPWPRYAWPEEGPPEVLRQRWGLSEAWLDACDAAHQAGSPDTYTPAAWAAWLGIAETAYRQLVD